jgi:hypothetical protein
MKALKVFAIIFGIISLLATFLPPMVNEKYINQINEQLSQVEDESMRASVEQELISNNMPTVGALQTATNITYTLSAFVLIGLVVLFAKYELLPYFAGLIILLAIASIVLHPMFDTGEYGGQAPRTMSFFHAIPSMLTAVFLGLYSFKKKAAAV